MDDADRCPATNRDGERCGHPAGWGTPDDDGPCKFHGGLGGDVGDEGGAPEGNGNAEVHGLTADREKWFERHREDAEPLVRALVESYVEDAPFGFENTAKVDLLTEVAIDQVRIRKSNDVLDEFVTEQVVGQTDSGDPIVTLEENPAHMPRSRIKRDNTRLLKELGVLDDPDSKQAAATQSLAEVLDE
jgi:hypothetical protein